MVQWWRAPICVARAAKNSRRASSHYVCSVILLRWMIILYLLIYLWFEYYKYYSRATKQPILQQAISIMKGVHVKRLFFLGFELYIFSKFVWFPGEITVFLGETWKLAKIRVSTSKNRTFHAKGANYFFSSFYILIFWVLSKHSIIWQLI